VAGKTGALCWVPLAEGQNAPQGEPQLRAGCVIKMADITDIYLGKQVLVFQSALAASAPANCCLSILSALNSLNLQASSPESLSAFLAALSNVLNGSGREVMLETPQEQQQQPAAVAQRAPSQKRYSVIQRNAVAPALLAGASGASTAAAVPSTLTLASADTLASMQRGHPFLLWRKKAKEEGGNVVAEKITLFYAPPPQGQEHASSSARFGALAWCPRQEDGKLVQRADSTLYLSDVQELFLGKQSPSFLSPRRRRRRAACRSSPPAASSTWRPRARRC